MATKEGSSFEDQLHESASGGAQVTPNDSDDLADYTRGLYVGGSGDVAVVMRDGSELTFAGMVAGQVYPLRVGRVKATGTTATGIVALW